MRIVNRLIRKKNTDALPAVELINILIGKGKTTSFIELSLFNNRPI